MRFFFYGTLMDPDVRRAVLGLRAPASAEAATLIGWRRVSIPGETYPTVVREPGGCVEGVPVRGLDYLSCRQLTAYEGRDYALVDVGVTAGQGGQQIPAMMFATIAQVRLGSGDWSLAAWTRRHKRATLAAIARRRPVPGGG